MTYFKTRAALLALGTTALVHVASAQQVIGFQPGVGQICSGPLGAGPCDKVMQYIQQHQPGLSNLPGAGAVPQDGQIVAEIAQSCGGEPRCMALSWASVEVQRCRGGLGTEGGCFGPNGEIMKVVNQFLPQNLHPNVIVGNIGHDIQHGPGENNDVVGNHGWLANRTGIHW